MGILLQKILQLNRKENMNFSGYMACELCGRREEEKSIQEQKGHYLCFQCNGKYDDEELEEKMKTERKIK